MERLTKIAEINKCPGIWVREGFANKGDRTQCHLVKCESR